MFLEFLAQEWMLAGAWCVMVLMLFYHEMRKGGQSISPQQLSDLVNRQGAVVVDIRDATEFRKGHITESKNIPFKDLAKRSNELQGFKDKPVIIVCKIGQHAGAASKQLKAEGFTQVYKLAGGLSEWTASNLPLVK